MSRGKWKSVSINIRDTLRFTLLFLGMLAIASCERNACEKIQLENKEELSVIVVGDTGTGNSMQNMVAQRVATYCNTHKCDLGIMMGDNVYDKGLDPDNPGTHANEWKSKFEDKYGSLRFPFIVALGNNDYGGFPDADPARTDLQIQYSGKNPKWIMPKRSFTCSLGPALFLVLDTTILQLDRFRNKRIKELEDSTKSRPSAQELKELNDLNALQPRLDSAKSDQEEMVSKAMKSTEKKWRVVVGHHPYISNGLGGNAGNYKGSKGQGDQVREFYEKHFCKDDSAQLYLAGHEHNMQALSGPPICPGVFLISGGGGQDSENLKPAAEQENEMLFGDKTNGFAVLEISATQVHAKIVNFAGKEEFDELVLMR